MPILFAGEDVASDCLAVAGADVVLPLGGDCARRGVAKQKATTAAVKRGRTITCLLWTPRLDSLWGSSDRTHRYLDDGERPCRGLLVKIPVPSDDSSWTRIRYSSSRRPWATQLRGPFCLRAASRQHFYSPTVRGAFHSSGGVANFCCNREFVVWTLAQ